MSAYNHYYGITEPITPPENEQLEPESENLRCQYCGEMSEKVDRFTLTFTDHITTVPICPDCIETLIPMSINLISIELFKL
jgi:hypothetical protein